mmetsp:Transcript_32469/g.36939  ORF Transcript_32469/g.36939 Transcript_32469/m.36939 type:complete len:306 (-) Transcript_32469:148-1065(-)
MLRIASNSLVKGVTRASNRSLPRLTPQVAFHASSGREDEAVESKELVQPVPKGGLFGSGINEWFALPVGLVVAVPLIKYELLVINEETQLLAVFCAFCVTMYTQGGDAMYKAMDETAQSILKEHTEAENRVIDSLKEKRDFLMASTNSVNDFQAINVIREEAYVNLNNAGIIKPKHDLKAQVEKMINMISQEEKNVAEKMKTALMEEATAAVTSEFETSKNLKKAALDSAINRIKGGAAGVDDPVQATFVKFFQWKAKEEAKVDSAVEADTQRAALVEKLNAVANMDDFFFRFDENGKPQPTVAA